MTELETAREKNFELREEHKKLHGPITCQEKLSVMSVTEDDRNKPDQPLTEHSRVALTEPLPELELAEGAQGVVVHSYPDAAAYEVEFFAKTGGTICVATVPAAALRPVTSSHDLAEPRSGHPLSREYSFCFTARGEPLVQ